MDKELSILKNKVHDDNINKLIDFNLNLDSKEADESIYIITEAQHGIPLFEWILTQNRSVYTENNAALIIREVFRALGVC